MVSVIFFTVTIINALLAFFLRCFQGFAGSFLMISMFTFIPAMLMVLSLLFLIIKRNIFIYTSILVNGIMLMLFWYMISQLYEGI